MVEDISPAVAQALADVAHTDATLTFDDAELVITWANGTKVVVAIDEDTPVLAYRLVTP